MTGSLRLTAAGAATAMGGTVVAGSRDVMPSGWSIDSRTLAAGDLFFAIRGDRFDGHAFAEVALRQGATGVVVSQDVPESVSRQASAAGPAVIRVDDTTLALQRLARHVRRLSGSRVVAVTGSAGKTTTKESTAEFLSSRYRVFRNKGNLNNHIGLPLSLLQLTSRPEVAVVELGMNHAGELRTLVGIAEPDVRVWTNVAEVHTAFFASLDEVADAKAEILEGARTDGLLVANAGDPLVMARVGGFAGRLVTFGVNVAADVRAEEVDDLGLEGVRATLVEARGRAAIRIPLLGRANLANVVAAAAVALNLGVPLEDIAARSASLWPSAHRGEVLRLRERITLLDDSYNSNPRALAAMLEVVRGQASRRVVAVLGEMLELGNESRRLHEACGREAARAGVGVLITVGGAAAAALGQAAAETLPPDRVVHVATSEEAADRVLALVRPGDLVFVKGSRGIRTEVVVDRLKQEKR